MLRAAWSKRATDPGAGRRGSRPSYSISAAGEHRPLQPAGSRVERDRRFALEWCNDPRSTAARRRHDASARRGHSSITARPRWRSSIAISSCARRTRRCATGSAPARATGAASRSRCSTRNRRNSPMPRRARAREQRRIWLRDARLRTAIGDRARGSRVHAARRRHAADRIARVRRRNDAAFAFPNRCAVSRTK